MTEQAKSLISGRLLARNTIWNFCGMAAPMLVALFAIPVLIDGFGKERFGMLAIIWMGVGYFTLFDMGFGRALTKLIADRIGTGDTEDIGSLIWTALSMILVFGLAGALIVGIFAAPVVLHVLNVGAALQAEGTAALQALSIGIPAVVVSAGLIGVLEAHQRFATISAVRIPLGVLTFVGPLITLQFSTSLVWATFALIIARMLAMCGFFYFAASVRPELKHPALPQKRHVFPLFQFGGWLSVTNVIGPLMVYFDRFLIGAILTMTAVTFYVTPYEVVYRLQVLPNSMMLVLFPALTTALTIDKQRLTAIYSQASKILLLLMLPVLSAFFLFAPEGLEIWLGPEFRQMSTPVVQWMAVGMLANTLARLPFTVLQSAGRPDLVAKTHLSELIPYAALLWVFTNQFGIAGTAAAWFLRVLADTMILNFLARLKVPELNKTVIQTVILLAGLLAGFALAAMLDSLMLRGMLFLAISAVSAILLWPLIRQLILSTGRVEKAPAIQTGL